MYAINPNINFKNLFFILFFTKNINAIAKNIQPIDPNDIHILSIDDTNNTTTTSTPFFNKNITQNKEHNANESPDNLLI